MFRYLLVLCPASQVHSCVFLSTDTIFAPQTAQAAAITGSYHDDEDKNVEDDLLDDLGEN